MKVSGITPGLAAKLLVVICLLWCGMVLGISFLATPVKFHAPTLSLAVGVDVGRTVFDAFNLFQLGCLLLAIGIAQKSRGPASIVVLLFILTASQLTQSFWLFPALYEQASQLIAGNRSAALHLHLLFGILELGKVLVLSSIAWLSLGVATAPAYMKKQ
ncbi:hypothetical protein [Kistimonas asteriae]|uniref:hypothetical protein n=1 Tax=Kistimonas asteriae TaxID=517724 RepID=UPI001BAB04BC|nr:hypothetical protein [Kistimonas asteriae]